MIIKKIFTIKREVFLFLLENAFRATPFNVLVAVLVAVELIYSGAPLLFVAGWFFVIVTISGVRWIWIRNALQKKTFHENLRFNLILFFILTFILGISWGVCYPIFLPFLTEFHEYIIILILGGMCVGAIASLSSYLPSYYAYMLPIFMPVIVYNYSFLNFDRFILATTFVLFVFMLLITATLSGKLVHRTFELTEQKQSLIYRLEIESITDPLTRLYNRRYFNTLLQREFDRAKRNKYPLSLISIDIDNFKIVNDTCGHPFGDKFLIFVGEMLQSIFRRANDSVFRLGGDEYAVITGNMTIQDVIAVCELLQEQFKRDDLLPQCKVTKRHHLFEQISLSIGIAHIPFDSKSEIENIILAADQALYEAKRQGKNRIIVNKIT